MNEEAQNSYFGKIYKQVIDRIVALQPGNYAPDFHLIAMDGKEITLNDCVGPYVLIYHWGLCPGSFQREFDVIDLYNKHKDRLIIVGITDRIEDIKEVYDNTKPEHKLSKLYLFLYRSCATGTGGLKFYKIFSCLSLNELPLLRTCFFTVLSYLFVTCAAL